MAKIDLLLFITATLLVMAIPAESRPMADDPSEKETASNYIINREGEGKVSEAPEPLEGSERYVGAESPEKEPTERHGGDRSVAGGGVIIGGLLTAILGSVFCYIRVTTHQKKKQ